METRNIKASLSWFDDEASLHVRMTEEGYLLDGMPQAQSGFVLMEDITVFVVGGAMNQSKALHLDGPAR